MKKDLLKKCVSIIIFFLLFSFALKYAEKVFIPYWGEPWPSTESINEFYQLPKNSVDVLAVGTSQMQRGFSPMELYKNYGIEAYNLGIESQTLENTYYWIKESYKTQKYKVLLLEMFGMKQKAEETNNRKTLDYMNFSIDKMKAIWVSSKMEAKENTDFWNSASSMEKMGYVYKKCLDYVFPILRYHDRWNELTNDDFIFSLEDKHDSHRGFYIVNYHDGEYYEIFDEDNDAPKSMFDDIHLEYLNKIIDFCHKNKIELILLKTPLHSSFWNISDYNAVKEIADNNNLAYFDFNTKRLLKESDIDILSDGEFGIFHLNLFGARKLTNYLGVYLKENYDLEDKRNNEKYDYLEKELEEYLEACYK